MPIVTCSNIQHKPKWRTPGGQPSSSQLDCDIFFVAQIVRDAVKRIKRIHGATFIGWKSQKRKSKVMRSPLGQLMAVFVRLGQWGHRELSHGLPIRSTGEGIGKLAKKGSRELSAPILPTTNQFANPPQVLHSIRRRLEKINSDPLRSNLYAFLRCQLRWN